MLHTVQFGNHETGYFFLKILKSGYAKYMLINKGGYDATIWAARPRHSLVQVTPSGKMMLRLTRNKISLNHLLRREGQGREYQKIHGRGCVVPIMTVYL